MTAHQQTPQQGPPPVPRHELLRPALIAFWVLTAAMTFPGASAPLATCAFELALSTVCPQCQGAIWQFELLTDQLEAVGEEQAGSDTPPATRQGG